MRTFRTSGSIIATQFHRGQEESFQFPQIAFHVYHLFHQPTIYPPTRRNRYAMKRYDARWAAGVRLSPPEDSMSENGHSLLGLGCPGKAGCDLIAGPVASAYHVHREPVMGRRYYRRRRWRRRRDEDDDDMSEFVEVLASAIVGLLTLVLVGLGKLIKLIALQIHAYLKRRKQLQADRPGFEVIPFAQPVTPPVLKTQAVRQPLPPPLASRVVTPNPPTIQGRKQLLSKGENAFYQPLKHVVDNRCEIQIKVRISDVVEVPVKLLPSVNQKHIDFLLCDKNSTAPILAIELDDKTHFLSHRRARDAFVDELFKQARIPLIHIRCQQAYDVQNLRDLVSRFLAAHARNHVS